MTLAACGKCGSTFTPKYRYPGGVRTATIYCSRACYLSIRPPHFCGSCHQQKAAADFGLHQHRRSGHTLYCRDCTNRRAKVVRMRPAQQLASYRGSAKARGHAFALSKAEFMEFWQKPCHYCAGPIDTVGLDRVDNSRGYERGNVVPCCQTCNLMKRDLTADDFIARCAAIAARWRARGVA